MAASRHIGTIRMNRQRQRPAFVLGRQHQEDEEHGQRESQGGGRAPLLRFSAHPPPGFADRSTRSTRSPSRQATPCRATCSIRAMRLAGADARRRVAGDFRRGIQVVVVDDGRPEMSLMAIIVLSGTMSPLALRTLSLPTSSGRSRYFGVGLDVDLPVAVVQGDVVDVGRAEVGLQGVRNAYPGPRPAICALTRSTST